MLEAERKMVHITKQTPDRTATMQGIHSTNAATTLLKAASTCLPQPYRYSHPTQAHPTTADGLARPTTNPKCPSLVASCCVAPPMLCLPLLH